VFATAVNGVVGGVNVELYNAVPFNTLKLEIYPVNSVAPASYPITIVLIVVLLLYVVDPSSIPFTYNLKTLPV
jgi:hypothetical protein